MDLPVLPLQLELAQCNQNEIQSLMSNYRKYNHILQCSLTVTFGFQIAGMCGQYLESQTQHNEAVEGVLEFIISHTLKVIHLLHH